MAVSCSQPTDTNGTGGQEPDDVASPSWDEDTSEALVKPAKGVASPKLKLKGKLSNVFGTKLRANLKSGKGQDVIVRLARPVATKGAKLAKQSMRVAHEDLAVKREFTRLPVAVVHVKSEAGLDKLLAQADVTAVYENQVFRPMTADSLPFIGQSDVAEAIAYDADGVGTPTVNDYIDDLGSFDDSGTQTAVGIALLDGKVDETHRLFGCAGVGPGCPIEDYASVTGDDSNSDHATTMAAILHAAAPAAQIYNVEITNSSDVALTSSILDALEQVATWVQAGAGIKVVSLSYGTTAVYTTEQDCVDDGGAISDAVDTLKGLGVVVLAAAGNGGSTDGVSMPACLPNVSAVGAVQGKTADGLTLTKDTGETCSQTSDDSDRILCNSNAGAALDLLGPGLSVDADVVGNVCVGGSFEGSDCTADEECNDNGTCDVGNTDVCVGGPNVGDPCSEDVDCQDDGACTDTEMACVGGLDEGDACSADPDCSGGTCEATLAPVTGTSVATAHAAAGVAIIYGAHATDAQGNETANRALARVKAGGVLVENGDNNVVAPRLQLQNSIGDCIGAYAATTSVDLDTSGTNTDLGDPVEAIDVETDTGCAIDTDRGANTWVTVTDPSDSPSELPNVLLTASDNAAGATRSGEVTAYGITFTVNQGGDETAPSVTALTATANGEFTAATGYVASTSVSVAITGSDGSGSGVSQVCIVNDTDATPPTACLGGTWNSFSSPRSWSLAAGGDGARYLHVWLKDGAGNVSTPSTLTLTLDTTDPTIGTLPAATRIDSPVGATLTPAGVTDTNFVGYKVAYRTDGTFPTGRCLAASGTTIVSTDPTSSPFSITGLTSGTTYSVRVCGYDQAGNASLGLTTTFKATNDLTAPAGDLVDAGGSQAGIGFVDSSTSIVDYTDGLGELLGSASGNQLRLVASDAIGITGYCLSSISACTSWTTVASTTALDLTVASPAIVGDGNKTFYVKFKDAAGNESAQYSTSALLDTTAPSTGSLALAKGVNKVALNMSGVTDASSGVAGFRYVRSTSSAPTSCTGGTDATPTVTAGAASFEDTGATAGTTAYYRVCAFDKLGNISAGVTGSTAVTDDTEKPTGTLVLSGTAVPNSAAGYTASAAVTLTITASDNTAPGVAGSAPQICVSTTALDGSVNCPDTATSGTVNNGWVAATTTTYTFAAGDGLKTLYYKFKDAANAPNNVSSVATASIRLDTTAPAAGVLTAVAVAGLKAKLTWTGLSDANNVTYGLQTGGCSGASVTATNGMTTVAGSAGSQTYCVTATDGAGRTRTASATVSLRSEVTAPTLSVTPLATCNTTTQCALVSSKKWTKDRTPAVNVTLTETGTFSGSDICFSATNNAASCTTWTPVTAASSGTAATYNSTVTLPTGSAARTFYVFGRDGVNNVSTGASALVYVDTVAPAGGTLTPAAASTTAISVKWTKPTDTGGAGFPSSSLYTLCFVKGTTTAASATQPACNSTMTGCTAGTKLSISTAAGAVSYSHTGLTKNTYYTYALCRKDILGNFSTLRKSVKTKAQ